MRKVEFANGEYYHIFNRGVEKREVFSCEEDYLRFLRSAREFNTIKPIGSLYEKYLRDKNHRGHFVSTGDKNKLVDIICYCLNPNHYHFILKQLEDRGIEKFMQRLGNGYTKYYNHKNNRSGVLFQGVFKSVYIESNDQLLYLSAYVNKNHFIHGYENQERTFDVQNGHQMSRNWQYSSLADYLEKNQKNKTLCNINPVMKQFKDIAEYEKFINENAVYMKEKKEENRYLEE